MVRLELETDRLRDLLQMAREMMHDKHVEYRAASEQTYQDAEWCTGKAAQQIYAMAADSMARHLEVIAQLTAAIDAADDRADDEEDVTVTLALAKWW